MGYSQRTVRYNISCTGIGLHSGKSAVREQKKPKEFIVIKKGLRIQEENLSILIVEKTGY